jgi:hypothetical protein
LARFGVIHILEDLADPKGIDEPAIAKREQICLVSEVSRGIDLRVCGELERDEMVNGDDRHLGPIDSRPRRRHEAEALDAQRRKHQIDGRLGISPRGWIDPVMVGAEDRFRGEAARAESGEQLGSRVVADEEVHVARRSRVAVRLHRRRASDRPIGADIIQLLRADEEDLLERGIEMEPHVCRARRYGSLASRWRAPSGSNMARRSHSLAGSGAASP